MLKFYVKVFYVMGKVLSGELSCPCDRSSCLNTSHCMVRQRGPKDQHFGECSVINLNFMCYEKSSRYWSI